MARTPFKMKSSVAKLLDFQFGSQGKTKTIIKGDVDKSKTKTKARGGSSIMATR